MEEYLVDKGQGRIFFEVFLQSIRNMPFESGPYLIEVEDSFGTAAKEAVMRSSVAVIIFKVIVGGEHLRAVQQVPGSHLLLTNIHHTANRMRRHLRFRSILQVNVPRNLQ